MKLMDETCLDLLRNIHATRTIRPELRIQIEDIYCVTGNSRLLDDMMDIWRELAMEEDEGILELERMQEG